MQVLYRRSSPLYRNSNFLWEASQSVLIRGKSPKHTRFCEIWIIMKISNNPAKYEVLIKQYLRGTCVQSRIVLKLCKTFHFFVTIVDISFLTKSPLFKTLSGTWEGQEIGFHQCPAVKLGPFVSYSWPSWSYIRIQILPLRCSWISNDVRLFYGTEMTLGRGLMAFSLVTHGGLSERGTTHMVYTLCENAIYASHYVLHVMVYGGDSPKIVSTLEMAYSWLARDVIIF